MRIRTARFELYTTEMDETAPNVPEAPSARRASFALIAGHGRLITHVLDKTERVIGRDPGCDIALEHAGLSRQHAMLRLGPPPMIQDLGSTNGTRVARRTVRGGPPIVLEHGETFHIGGFSFSLVTDDERTSSSTNAAAAQRAGRPHARLSAEALARLAGHDWPGNVRDLKAVVERALLLSRDGDIAARHLAFSPRVDGSTAVATHRVAATVAPADADDPLSRG